MLDPWTWTGFHVADEREFAAVPVCDGDMAIVRVSEIRQKAASEACERDGD